MRLARDQQHPQFVARTSSIATTARLLTSVSLFSGEASISTMFGPACLISISTLTVWLLNTVRSLITAVAPHHDLGATAADALIVQPVGDGLDPSDDAETGRG